MKLVKFVYNPVSGEGTILEYLDDIIGIYQKEGLNIVPFRLSHDHTACRIMEGVDSDTYHHVLIAGGDGTVNSVVNQMKKEELDIPIAVLPTGTANDFANLFGMPSGVKEACREILRGEVCNVDLGKVNDRYFINVLSSGLFTDISQKTPTLMKNTFGKLAYYFSSVQELPNFRKIHINVVSREMVFNDNCLVFFVFNGRTAGNLRFGYLSDAQDGLLDVLILRGDNVGDTIRMIFHFLGGMGREYPHGVVHFKTKKLTVSSHDRLAVDIDGEGGITFPLEIECIEGGIKVIRPVKAKGSKKDRKLF